MLLNLERTKIVAPKKLKIKFLKVNPFGTFLKLYFSRPLIIINTNYILYNAVVYCRKKNIRDFFFTCIVKINMLITRVN